MPAGLNQFVLVKAALVAAGAGLAVLVPPRGRLPRGVWVLVISGATLLISSALLGAQPVAQFIGRAPRFEGVLVLSVYVAAAAAGAHLWGPSRSDGDDNRLIRLLAAAAVLVAVIAVLETFGLRPLESSASRPGSLLGNASDQGAWALLAMGPLTSAAVARRDPWSMVGAVAAALCVATSASRGALVGAVIVLGVLVIAMQGTRSRKVLAAAMVGLAGLSLLLPVTRSRIFAETPLAGATAAGRTQLWQESLDLAKGHLLLGTGPSGFVDAITSVHTPTWYRQVGPQFPPDSPHSWPLQALSAGGLGILLIALALGSLTLISGWRKTRATSDSWLPAGALAGIAGYATALLFHFTSPGPTTLAALMGGLLLAEPTHRVRTGPGGRPRATGSEAVAAGASGVLSAVLLAGAVAEIPLRTAILAASQGNLALADDNFHTAARLRPWDVSVAETAGHAFAVISQVDPSQAADLADPWLHAAAHRLPASPTVAADRAIVADASGKYDLAITLWTHALALDPNNPDLLLGRGISHAAGNDLDAAEADFEAAAALAPNSPAPATNLDRVHQMREQQRIGP